MILRSSHVTTFVRQFRGNKSRSNNVNAHLAARENSAALSYRSLASMIHWRSEFFSSIIHSFSLISLSLSLSYMYKSLWSTINKPQNQPCKNIPCTKVCRASAPQTCIIYITPFICFLQKRQWNSWSSKTFQENNKTTTTKLIKINFYRLLLHNNICKQCKEMKKYLLKYCFKCIFVKKIHVFKNQVIFHGYIFHVEKELYNVVLLQLESSYVTIFTLGNRLLAAFMYYDI